jgi:hypothetical protein
LQPTVDGDRLIYYGWEISQSGANTSILRRPDVDIPAFLYAMLFFVIPTLITSVDATNHGSISLLTAVVINISAALIGAVLTLFLMGATNEIGSSRK